MHVITSIKTLQSGSKNVVHSATAHTRPDLQTKKCGAVNFAQTPYVSFHLARVLSGGQLHCHVCSHMLYAIHALLLLHGQSDMQCSATFLQCQIRNCCVCKHKLVVPIHVYGCLNWNAHHSQHIP